MTSSAQNKDWSSRHCAPCRKGDPQLDERTVETALVNLPGWERRGGEIGKTYSFSDYHRTMAFVNAVAWMAHRENHHPELEVGYNRCRVRYTTHDVGGLSENDLICAAKVEELLAT